MFYKLCSCLFCLCPFHTVSPVNYCKITSTTFPLNTERCCSNMQWRSVFLPVRYHSHISTRILVASDVSTPKNENYFIDSVMSFWTRKTFVNFWNTNEDILDEIREVSEPSICRDVIATFNAQKGSKEFVKIVHVTTVVQL